MGQSSENAAAAKKIALVLSEREKNLIHLGFFESFKNVKIKLKL